MTVQIPREWVDIRKAWSALTGYQRFETLAAVVLRLVIALIIIVALYRLVAGVITALVLRAFNPLDHTVYQVVFGGIMTVLITLEFGHTLQYFFTRGRGIIQAKIVILIALLAIARKVIVTDPFEAPPASVLALAVARRTRRVRRPDPPGLHRAGGLSFLACTTSAWLSFSMWETSMATSSGEKLRFGMRTFLYFANSSTAIGSFSSSILSGSAM
jgi:uncharacterized membrane protein (DUF373 family)